MSQINLERLRIRQSFFVPIRREKLKTSIYAELIKDYGKQHPLSAIRQWTIEEHGNVITFTINYGYIYVLLSSPPVKDTPEEVKKRIEEYENKPAGVRISEARKLRRFCLPDKIYVTIIRSEERGCEIEVECLPNLYGVISQLGETEVHEHEMQDAHITCERFLRTIFIGGLSGTVLAEKKITLPRQTKAQLLINDISTRRITEKINEMLDSATGEVLIFGWIGTFLLKKLRELKEKGLVIKVITGNVKTIRQDPMKKEKERAMKELISIIGKDRISVKLEFHGRAVVVDNKALIGSMDLDSYSLTGTRIEFATYTEDPEIVRSLRNYFNRLFTPWKEKKQKS